MEYTGKYSATTRNVSQYYRDELNDKIAIPNHSDLNLKKTSQAFAAGTKDIERVVSSKHL